MKITAIKGQVKNENRASIFVDGKYLFSLTLDQLLEQKLKKGDELDELRLKALKKLSDEGKLKARTLEWLMNRPHSTRELREYMYKKKADKALIAAWVDEFTEKNYLDDAAFARWFAENRQRKNKSARAITAELYAKGISKQHIDSALRELDVADENALAALIAKLKSRPRYSDEDRLKRYLMGRGFSYADIQDALQQE